MLSWGKSTTVLGGIMLKNKDAAVQ